MSDWDHDGLERLLTHYQELVERGCPESAERGAKPWVRRRGMAYAIKVIDEQNDAEGFVCDGMSDHPTRYYSKRDAKEFADFMRIGMDETIVIVPYPERGPRVRIT